MEDNLFNLKFVDINELSEFEYHIKDIQNRKIDGVIIKNFLNSNETKIIKERVENNIDQFERVQTGFTYPVAYWQADKSSNEEHPIIEQFKRWEGERKRFSEFLGVEIETKVKDVLQRVEPGVNIKVLQGKDSLGSYIPFTVRVFEPNKDGITIHCGNMFEKMLPTLYADLKSKVETFNQLSYFMVVQNNLEGGELTLYNLNWIEGQEPEGTDNVIHANGEVYHGKEMPRVKLKLDEGDLIIFAAGEIWHRVESPMDRARITIGGFMGYIRGEENLAIWS